MVLLQNVYDNWCVLARARVCEWRLMELTQVYFNMFFVTKPLNISGWEVVRAKIVPFGIFLDVFHAFNLSLFFLSFKSEKILFTFKKWYDMNIKC